MTSQACPLLYSPAEWTRIIPGQFAKLESIFWLAPRDGRPKRSLSCSCVYRHSIALEIRLDGEPIESETTCIWADGYVLVLATTLPDPGLAIGLHSTLVGHEGVPTCVTHLTLGPVEFGPVISTAEHEHANLDPKINSRACVYEHWSVLLEHLTALGYAATQHVPEDAFTQLASLEGMI